MTALARDSECPSESLTSKSSSAATSSHPDQSSATAAQPPPSPPSPVVPTFASPDDPSPALKTLLNAPTNYLSSLLSLPKINRLTPAERERILRRNETYVPPPPSGRGDSVANGATIAIVSLFSSVLMRCMNSLHVYRTSVLTSAVEHRPNGMGLLTVSNHRSVADDPIMLAAMLPPRIILRPGLMRWGMCSADICFQNRFISRFMNLGKALPIMRGAGVSHPLVQQAADKLAGGDWLHVYPEGRVVQTGMDYMKRGVGKILAYAHENAEASAMTVKGDPVAEPLVIPIYHEGMENVMPQDKETHKLIRYMPSVGQNVYAIIGDPISLRDVFEEYMPACAQSGGTKTDSAECLQLFEALADRLAVSVRLLRAELRLRVRAERGVFLGDPFEVS